jgi:hypothetical protein
MGEGFSVTNWGTTRFRADAGSTLTLENQVEFQSTGMVSLGRNRVVAKPGSHFVIAVGSILEAEIGGPTVGTDLGGIEGVVDWSYVAIDGTLRLRQLAGYEPADGTSFPIVRMTDGTVVQEGQIELPGPGWTSDWNLSLSRLTATYDRRTSVGDVELQADGPRRVVKNEPFVVEVEIENLGPRHAFDARITTTLDDDVRLLGVDGVEPCWGIRVVRCKIDELAPSGTAAIQLHMSGRRAGKVLTRSSVSSLSLDENEANNVVRLRATITAP